MGDLVVNKPISLYRGGISMGKLQKKLVLVSNLYQFWVCQRHMTCIQTSEHCRWENVLAETAGSDTTDFLLWFCGKTAAHSFPTPCHILVCLFCSKLSLTLGKGHRSRICHWYPVHRALVDRFVAYSCTHYNCPRIKKNGIGPLHAENTH